MILYLLLACSLSQQISPGEVTIKDAFWSPRLKVWHTKTAYDVLNKLEGKYVPDREDLIKEKATLGHTRNAFANFDRVAKGEKDSKKSEGPPWYDGLVYETIRGDADLLLAYPDKELERKLDGYIERIAAAQNADPDGYINTYTTLNQPGQRWGMNGGNDRWQHDVYNAGMLVDAGIHYYNATGKTRLLECAVKIANYMCGLKVIPGHAGPEEAFLKLYLFFQDHHPVLHVPVKQDEYLALSRYWIEHRGVDAGGSSYNQDHQPVFDQQTIEGHAVRATLLGTAIAAMASYSHDERYINTANNYWNNMVGKRMFITGGEGAIPEDEKFGPDYYLPESAYLETCAAVGAAFFSQRMNELQADGKYMDEFERVLYNNMLSGISMDGTHYHYENPLVATNHPRWAWHFCPCCPPMFLKMIGALPGYIYARDEEGIFVNLFIGSEARINVKNDKVKLVQTTGYPWKGDTRITVTPERPETFTIHVRIPGWAMGKENPFDLYHSSVTGKVSLKVNGRSITVSPVNGYVTLSRKWQKGDVIELALPVEPRLITPNEAVETLKGKVAISAGPLVYSFEGTDVENYRLDKSAAMKLSLMGGTGVITGKLKTGSSFTAIPFYATGNRGNYPYKVWIGL
jgi:DUF1680 family protein